MRSSLQTACDIIYAYLDTLAGEPVQRSHLNFYLDCDLSDLEALQYTGNMTDYFSEYSSFIGAKGLPSPADTPYETPGFLRSKRSSRATTAGSSRSREQSASPPPLPPDAIEYADKSREGRYSALDPRRFTPTLHASLVSEILSLRRELDSKNNLVENLETSLASAKTDNETLTQELTTNAQEVRNARQQMTQMETGAYEALETMVKERDSANDALQEMRARLDATQKKTRGQDEDAERTQSIWEREKEQWENERRQLERRVHITETRLRTFVEEMAQQAAIEEQPLASEDLDDQTTFKDSALGNDGDTVSMPSHTTGKRHTRNVSSLSFINGFRNSIVSRATDTPEPFAKPGYSLADELDIDEEDEEDEEDEKEDEKEDDDKEGSESGEEELEYHQRPKHISRHGSMVGDMESKAKRILGLSDDMPVSPAMREFPKDIQDDSPVSPSTRDFPRDARDETNRADADSKAKRVLGLSSSIPRSPSLRDLARDLLEPMMPSNRKSSVPTATSTALKVQYVDTGYQPSPPSSPTHSPSKHKPQPLQVPQAPCVTPTVHIQSSESYIQQLPIRQPVSVAAKALVSPISPPETPIDGATWPDSGRNPVSAHKYASASTQTEGIAPALTKTELPERATLLQVPVAVPQIAIHPPTSRPSSPRPAVLPPGTKNAGSQVDLPWPGKDASVQTEEIRIDQRPVKLPPHLLPSHLDSLSEQPVSPKRISEPVIPPRKKASKRNTAHKPKISTDLPMLSSFPSPPMRSPTDPTSPTHTRDGSVRDLGKMPLKAIPLPKPTLAPPFSMDEVAGVKSKGPLNRSAQFGVSDQNRNSRQLAELDDVSDVSDDQDSEANDQAGSMPVLNAAGRFEGPDPSQFIFDGLPSPQRRPTTSDSYDAAPAPSVSSSRNNSHRGVGGKRPPPSRSSAQLKTHSRNESFGSVASSNYSTQSSLPPHAIPKRSSSRFPPHTYSENGQSPTPGVASSRANRSMRGGHQRQGSLRKVQSAVSMRGRAGKISPQKPRRRRRSPNLTPVQSMAFESPAPTKFPIPELPTPLQQSLAFDFGNQTDTSPAQRPGTATSSLPPNEESQLIDSIAGTMVGEWMWKYMRKRKSFGVDAAEGFTSRNGEENGPTLTSHGTRHKRWVWLSPYERTIMWDSKQPTSGHALMGKKGRKRKSGTKFCVIMYANYLPVTIQSVIDVADDTPLPKRPELPAAFHRSILILTPSRALKFTAVNAERHALWMSALSFLSESDQANLPHLPSVPPIPEQYQKSAVAKRPRSPSFGRSHLRDSVNLAKGRQPSLLRSVSAQNASAADIPDIPRAATDEQDQGAAFPCIPRLYSNTNRHQRKRSNTTSVSPRPFPGLRSFSSNALPSTSSSNGRFTGVITGRPHAATNTTASSQSDSRRPSESVNGLNSPDQFNFFDAVGGPGVRMQAFVDPAIKNGVLYVPPVMPTGPPPSVPQHSSPRKARGRGNSNLSSGSVDKRRAGYVFDDDGTDPFKGF